MNVLSLGVMNLNLFHFLLMVTTLVKPLNAESENTYYNYKDVLFFKVFDTTTFIFGFVSLFLSFIERTFMKVAQ